MSENMQTDDDALNITNNFAREIIDNRDYDEVETVLVGTPPSDRFEEDTRMMVRVALSKDRQHAVIDEDVYTDRHSHLVSIENVKTASQACLECILERFEEPDGATEIEHNDADFETVFDFEAVMETFDVDVN